MAIPSFRDPVPQAAPLRPALLAAAAQPEATLVAGLIAAAAMTPAAAAETAALAQRLVTALRGKRRGGLVEQLLQELSLSSDEGVALMCLAEALLRIPDAATRDVLIRDKIADQDWEAHLGKAGSLFANAATWALVVTGRFAQATASERLPETLRALVARAGEPAVRAGVATMMRLLGEQFVRGETIAEALDKSARLVARGFTYSYDMLGEAATTAADADRYASQYETAIHAIGQASEGRGVVAGPGISIKLSALHPRYGESQRDRVMTELQDRVRSLAALAGRYDIGFNIDAEEADRLELSLDILEALAADPALAGWHGLGFVVQAYGRRALPVIDHVIGLARDTGHRLMVRLVKGAYWDTEIKRAQAEGHPDFPVFTRKAHTDISYRAAAMRLLAARADVFPQFATHNAQTVAAIHMLAGPRFAPGDYEFQCLHGMGEALYQEVVGPDRLNRPCRIYAPVGTHETLLAYLVRRLLENGANSSFVNRIADDTVPVAALVADPVDVVRASDRPGSPHPQIANPERLFSRRRNSAGLNLSDRGVIDRLGRAQTDRHWVARPLVAGPDIATPPHDMRNPADDSDRVGAVHMADPAQVDLALAAADAAARRWGQVPPAARAGLLERAADLYQARRDDLLWLIVREAGKTMANAVGELREAVDFLRYYASEIRDPGFATTRPLGPVACISPWNFPLAIFTGQVAAALAAGNPVVAKPAEETPLIAAAAVTLLHEAGVPNDVLQMLPGDGEIGARLVAHRAVRGVVFTGSFDVARHIHRAVSARLTPEGRPVTLIAETGGINAMVVDSSALREQVVADVLSSGFDSAGQRCSALRMLFVQDEVYARTRDMLVGAMQQLRVGHPARLSTDIGPIIAAAAQQGISAHIAAMRARGFAVHQSPVTAEMGAGHFVPPTLIEVNGMDDVTREVFGPVVHMAPFAAGELPAVMARINASGFALTFGLHTRLDSAIATATRLSAAGNIYINRNIIGAVVGTQPFGGSGLSGTGPKAGGPLYLRRLVQPQTGAVPASVTLDIPVGETNRYCVRPHGGTLLVSTTDAGRAAQHRAVAAAGGTPIETPIWDSVPFDSVLIEAEGEALLSLLARLAARPGPLPLVQALAPAAIAAGADYDPRWLVHEQTVSTNVAAAGGNATLMAMADADPMG